MYFDQPAPDNIILDSEEKKNHKNSLKTILPVIIIILLIFSLIFGIFFALINGDKTILSLVYSLPILAAGVGVLLLKKQYDPIEISLIQEEKTVKSLKEEDIQLTSILNSIREGIVITNTKGQIIFANKRASGIIGIDFATLKNYPINKIFLMDDVAGKITQGNIVNLESVVGKKLILRINSFPLITEGQIKGTIYLVFDITAESELEKMKLDFVTQAAHQLRTPLTIVRSYLDVIKPNIYNQIKPEDRDYLDRIIVGADRLHNLIENLLNVSVIEEGKLKLNLVTCPIDTVIADAVNKSYIYAQQKKVKLRLFKSNQIFPPMLIDPYLISEALINMITNAIEYTPSGKEVSITLQTQNNHIMITIADQGEGISSDMVKHLFQKFYKASNSLTQRSPGMGLGLYNAKAIIEAHKGTISVNSILGHGASFIITLPIIINSQSSTSNLNQTQAAI